MRFFVLFLFAALLMSACRDISIPWGFPRAKSGAKSEAVSADSEKGGIAMRFASGDPVLDEIALEARAAISDFIRHMRNPQKGEEQFRIKYPFPADSGSGIDKEYIWLSGITFKNGRYYGCVANRPYYISGIKEGSEAAFSMDDIADWMYLRNGKIVGGRSIKYLIEKIPPLDRDEEMERVLSSFP